MYERGTIVIGAFYAMPGGVIARTQGWDGRTREVKYRLDDDGGPRLASEAEVLGSWDHRPDLRDFPNARDPVLPFVFDLNWDAKRRSDLPPLLADPDVADDVEAAMREHGIELGEELREQVEAIRDAARPGF